MRTTAIILGIIAATFLLPQVAFARGGKENSKNDRRKSKVEVVTEPVVVERGRRTRGAVKPVAVKQKRPEVVVVSRASKPHRQPARLETHAVRHAPRHQVRHAVRHSASHPVHHQRRPVVQQHRHHERCGFIPGHFEQVAHEVVVPGYNKKVYVAPVYVERCTPRGVRVKVMVRAAGWRNVWVPATTLTRYEQVWVDGQYSCGR